MEFNEKLQELRKQKGFTQEELAELLFVSRTAVSKWESGRGYPNIDSLKAISKLFSVTIDELLSGNELLSIAEEENKNKESSIRSLVFGLLDISVIMLLFLPFFAQKVGDFIKNVSLLSLNGVSSYLVVSYFTLVIITALTGLLELAFQNFRCVFWLKSRNKISVLLSILGTVLFIISLQPYSAVFLFVFLIIKTLMLIKWHWYEKCLWCEHLFLENSKTFL